MEKALHLVAIDDQRDGIGTLIIHLASGDLASGDLASGDLASGNSVSGDTGQAV